MAGVAPAPTSSASADGLAGGTSSPPPIKYPSPPPTTTTDDAAASAPYAVHVNQPDWPAERVRQAYKTNYISTQKYTVLTFLPLNLFHQFSRFYNLYFLLTAILSLAFPNASPINPFLTVFPLALVLTVTALKDIYEDWLRYRSDQKANGIACTVSSHGQAFHTVKSQDIRPGDLVEVHKDEAFPADLLLLAAAHIDGHALVQTAQLDGETNLKRRKAVFDVDDEEGQISKMTQLVATIECEAPNENMYKFEGRMSTGKDKRIPLRPLNVLLRGALLRNTDKIVGVAVYVGKDTKIMRNLRQTRLKFSTLERRVNLFVMGIFIFNMAIWFLSLGLSAIWQDKYGRDSWYIDWDLPGVEVGFVVHLVTYFVLWTYLIPLSLFVSIELCRIAQLLFMNSDEKMISVVEGEDVYMSCNNSNLNEDLGRIEHIFSDKTGTLTQNLMNMRGWYIDGNTYNETLGAVPADAVAATVGGRPPGALARTIRQISDGLLKAQPESIDRLRLLLRAVALCNTVVPSWKSPAKDAPASAQRKLAYEADSPDELALLEAAQINGVELRERREDGVTIALAASLLAGPGGPDPRGAASASASPWIEENWTIIQILEFSSDRKRMSVLVQAAATPDAPIYLITKGADSVMMRLMATDGSNPPAALRQVQQPPRCRCVVALALAGRTQAIDTFARQALRTLLFGYRQMTRAEADKFMAAYRKADQAIGNRAEQVAEVCATVERDLIMLGCSAVEDKLQIDCAETIRYLMDAGIHFWLLTGDKKETAIAVGVQSALLSDPSSVLYLEADTVESVGQRIYALQQQVTPNEQRVLVVEGATLYYVLDTVWSRAFLTLAESTKSVICCRVTPLQKALVVQLVKSNLNRICLSIGDGANDVSMIEAANIGVGIVGKEGSQAVRASDYSFVEFRSLKRLVAIHGRYSYLRMRQLVLYSFYKNIAFILVIFWFGIYSAWSGQSIYNDSILAMVNVIYLSLPPLVQGIFEKDVSEHVIYGEPKLYREVQRNIYFSTEAVTAWMASGFYQCVVLFFPIALAVNVDGTTIDFRTMSFYYSTAALSVVLIKSLLTTRQIMWVNWFAVLLSFAAYIGTVFALGLAFPYTGSDTAMFTSGVFYFSYLLTIVVALVPDVCVAYWARQERPHDWEILQEIDVLGDRSQRAKTKLLDGRLSRADSSVQEEVERMLPPTSSKGYGSL